MLEIRNSLIKAKDCLINLVFTFLSTIGLDYVLCFVVGPFVIMNIVYGILRATGIVTRTYFNSYQALMDKLAYGMIVGQLLFWICYYLVIRNKTMLYKFIIKSSLKLNKLTWKQIGFYIAFGIVTSGMFYNTNKFLGNVFPEAMKGDKQFLNSIKDSFAIIALSLSLTLITPIHEEIIFRNIVPRKLKKTFSPFWIIIIQALFFGISHGNLVKGLSTSFFAIFDFLIVLWSGSLYASIIVHFINNLQPFIKAFINIILIKVFSCSDILAGQILDKFYLLVGILFIPMLWIAYKNRKYNALDKEHPYYD